MKKILLIRFITVFACVAMAQDSGPKEVTPQKLQKIKADVEKDISSFRKKNANNVRFAAELELMVDTFRIEMTYKKVVEIDYSTAGIVNAAGQRTNDYDKLLNKYYNHLLKTLKPIDKKVLITAQRAWLNYRNNEHKLISMLSEDQYSGGGTIQNVVLVDRYANVVKQRAISVGQYCVDTVGMD